MQVCVCVRERGAGKERGGMEGEGRDREGVGEREEGVGERERERVGERDNRCYLHKHEIGH